MSAPAFAIAAGRTGALRLERLAIARVRADVAAMPASDVVQLALWPDTLSQWAQRAGLSSAVVYNMLAWRARRASRSPSAVAKPYHRAREMLAARLNVSKRAVDHLIEADPPIASTRRPLDQDGRVLPPRVPAGDLLAAAARRAGEPAWWPQVRDGANPIEVAAVAKVETEIAALPASLVVQLVMFDETLAEWGVRQRLTAALVYHTLSGTSGANHRIRESLARRLGVHKDELDALIDTPHAEPKTLIPQDLVPPGGPIDGFAAPAGRPADPRGAPDRGVAGDEPVGLF